MPFQVEVLVSVLLPSHVDDDFHVMDEEVALADVPEAVLLLELSESSLVWKVLLPHSILFR